jgi:hypothetical protein
MGRRFLVGQMVFQVQILKLVHYCRNLGTDFIHVLDHLVYIQSGLSADQLLSGCILMLI